MAKKLCVLFMVFGLSGLWFFGCKKQVKRVDVDEVRDISGRWNDTDSRLVSEEMIQDFLSKTWYEDYTRRKGKRPDVIVGSVKNKTAEHISTETFVKDLERALLNSGKVQFVASKEERTGIREEREDQATHALPESQKPSGREAGADFMIIGQINSIIDREKKEQVTFYQVELEAVDMIDHRKIWIGQKKIKKYIKSPNKKF